MNPPQPPPRAPIYDWEESGGARRDAARFLIDSFVRVVESDPDWRGPDFTVTFAVREKSIGRAVIGFTSTLGGGRIEFSIGNDCWVLAEVYRGDEFGRRAWCEQPYEEPAIWPDGSDGEIKDKEPAARMSKRFWWITFWHSWGWDPFSIEIVDLDYWPR